MKYLNLFDNHNDYEDYVDGGLMSYPNVSYCIEEDELHYMKESPVLPYEKQYLTFEVVEAGTITITKSFSGSTVTIQYSTDDGQNWTSLTTSTSSQSLGNFNIGDKVMIKCNNTKWGGLGTYNCFGGTAKTNVYGNIMSLIYEDNFIGQNTLEQESIFVYLFRNYTNLLSAENLILPATTLTKYCYGYMFWNCTSLIKAPKILPATILNYTTSVTGISHCYQYMFQGCTSLTTAPELPATKLSERCYLYMFDGCTSLNYIKCLAIDSPYLAFSNWTNGVAATGTFVKNSLKTDWETGVNGIPAGWTVQDA